MKQILPSLSIVCILISSCSPKINLAAQKQSLALSAIKGKKSKVDTLVIYNAGKSLVNIQTETN